MQETILSQKIKTRDISLSLSKFAKNNSIALKECDFTINHIDTYMNCNSIDDTHLYNEDIYEYYTNPDKLLNEHLKLHQIFTITAKKANKKTIKLDYSIDFSEYNIHPKLIISPKSNIPYQSYKQAEILLILVKEINKIKAKNKILIKIFDDNMIKNLKLFVKHLYANKFTKKIKITLFDGIDPLISRKSKTIYWYKEKDISNQVIDVEADEILVEYKKAIFGKTGFDCFGSIVENGNSDKNNTFTSEIDENSVKLIENDDKKVYKSKVKGFVHHANNLLSVDNRVNMRQLSRVQNAVTEEEDNNIEVHISQHDTNQDSVREGVSLQSEIINITGHVGANSTLEALSLKIDGATHKTSVQYAKDAVINRHKGELHCNNAKINLLEGGIVHASNVEVEASLGGAIYAENVTVNLVKNNLKIYASNSITIKLVTGEDNIFKINYKDVPIVINKIKYLDEEINKLRDKLVTAKRHQLDKVDGIQSNIRSIRNKQKDIRQNVINAKIIIEKPLKGLNTIIFTTHLDDEIEFKTDARLYKPFYIELTQHKLTLYPVNKSIKLKS